MPTPEPTRQPGLELSPNKEIDAIYENLKDIAKKRGMGSIGELEMEAFDHLMEKAARYPEKYETEHLSKLFGLIGQLASAEIFSTQEIKDMYLRQIQLYKIELVIE